MSTDPRYVADLLALFQKEDPAGLIGLRTRCGVAGSIHPATLPMSDAGSERLSDGTLRLQREYGVIELAAGEGT